MTSSSDADVLIVGGGIAGLSAAWFATRARRRVTIVDDGRHRASDLPVALINPLRGHGGRLVRDGVDGMRATFALVDALCAEGHGIEHARGLYRPLVDLADDVLTEGYWRARLASRLDFEWHADASRSLGLADDVPSLYLREAGWVAAPRLLAALRAASAPTAIDGRVVRIEANAAGGGVATLSDGTAIAARTLLWCGGAWGCAGFDRNGEAGDAIYKPGSLLATGEALTASSLAFGLYAIPAFGDGPYRTIVGPTREGSRSAFDDSPAAPDVVARLQDRVARTFGSTMTATPLWRGVRLARLSTAARRGLAGVATLTALDSRGFLMAPLLAAAWARSL